MTHERLPDCRPPRPDFNVTYASSHPELTTGDFAMPTRIPVILNSADQDAVVKWSWGYAIALVLLVVVTLALPGLRSSSETSLAESEEPISAAQLALP
jgi:hypothetical protein